MAKAEIPIQVTISVEDLVEYLKKDGTLVEVVRCKDCKYKPKWREGASEKSRDGFDLIFPNWRDNTCPCQCEDGYYTHMPDDNWFCADGERKEE